MLTRCYLEITNICNLSCAFCPKTTRTAHTLTTDEFDTLTDRLRGQVQYLYLHLMGEPFLHPSLPDFVRMSREKGFIPILTTNGTLLGSDRAFAALDEHPYKVQISLHSQEGNGRESYREYIDGVMRFAAYGAERGVIMVLRLWNHGGLEDANPEIIAHLRRHIPGDWTETRNGYRLTDRIFLEHDEAFEWPDADRETEYDKHLFCYALRNQIGVLVDGTVVPCCLDHNGDMPLGNLYESPLNEILDSTRARAIYDGFTRHEAVEPLCRRCGYAAETKNYR